MYSKERVTKEVNIKNSGPQKYGEQTPFCKVVKKPSKVIE